MASPQRERESWLRQGPAHVSARQHQRGVKTGPGMQLQQPVAFVSSAGRGRLPDRGTPAAKRCYSYPGPLLSAATFRNAEG